MDRGRPVRSQRGILLTGIADALREGFRDHRLAVTTLQLGYLNTEDALSMPLDEAASRGGQQLIPVHDGVTIVRAVLSLSGVSLVRDDYPSGHPRRTVLTPGRTQAGGAIWPHGRSGGVVAAIAYGESCLDVTKLARPVSSI